MKRKNILILIGLSALVALPLIPSAQLINPEDHKKALDWVQGGNIHEDWFMKEFLSSYRDAIWDNFDWFIGMAQSLAAIFTIISFSMKSYEMMTGDKHLEIMPLLRPFGLAMVILWWLPFCKVVSYPTELIAAKASARQLAQQQRVNNLRFTRAEYLYAFNQNLFEKEAETEVAAEESKSFLDDPMGSMGRAVKKASSAVFGKVVELKNRMQIGIQLIMTQALEVIALWILRIAVYFIFALQIIYSSILVILGPLSVSMSILPAFRDSFSTWIARFISVNLYAGIAYLVMFICGIFQEFAMNAEIKRYAMIVNQDGTLIDITKLMYLKGSGILSFGMVIVSFLLSAITMFTVPSISTWIVSTSGITSAVSTFGRQGLLIGRQGARMAAKFFGV